jgi:hypothetical protein
MTRLFGTVTPEPDTTLTLDHPTDCPPGVATRPDTAKNKPLDTKRIQ